MPSIASEFLAIDRKQRARTPSMEVSTRPVEDRLCDFNDVVIPLTPEEANQPHVSKPARLTMTSHLPCG